MPNQLIKHEKVLEAIYFMLITGFRSRMEELQHQFNLTRVELRDLVIKFFQLLLGWSSSSADGRAGRYQLNMMEYEFIRELMRLCTTFDILRRIVALVSRHGMLDLEIDVHVIQSLSIVLVVS